MQASDGNLYGTGKYGGKNGVGVLFRAALSGDVVSLHDFDYSTGAVPEALLQHTNGIVYGTTLDGRVGGSRGDGTFYSFDLGLPPFVTYLPTYGRAGAEVLILGQGFTDASQVFFNGTPASCLYEDHGPGWSHDRPDHRHHREWHTDQQQGVHCAPIDSHADATGHRS